MSPAGFELTTFSSGGRRSIQLSYGPKALSSYGRELGCVKGRNRKSYDTREDIDKTIYLNHEDIGFRSDILEDYDYGGSDWVVGCDKLEKANEVIDRHKKQCNIKSETIVIHTK